MLDNFYVHRPLKEAIHAVRPIQRLRVLLRRLQQATNIPVEEKDELTFPQHADARSSTRCATFTPAISCRGPIATTSPTFHSRWRISTRAASAAIWSPGSCPATRSPRPDFGPGAELLYWNGMAIERAVRGELRIRPQAATRRRVMRAG